MMKNIFGFGAVFLLMIVGMAASAFAAGPDISPAIGAKTVNEGALLSFTVSTTAPDNLFTDPVTFKLCDATSNAACTLHASPLAIGTTSATLVNTSQVTAKFEWTPSFTQAGMYVINISANDADSSNSQLVTITVNDVAPTMSAPALSLGGSNQKRSNPLAEDLEDENVNVTQTLTIANTGGEAIKNLAFSTITGVGKYSSSFTSPNSKGVTLSATEIPAGGSVTATITLRVPENLDAVDSSQQLVALDVATLAFTGTRADGTTAITQLNVPVKMQAENNLEIKNAKIIFREKSEKLRDNKNINGIKPGDAIEMEFEVESQFKDKAQIDIKRITIEVISTGDDKDLDVSEEEDVDDLGPEDVESVKVLFDVEGDAKKGKEDMVIILKGEDENGAVYGERWEITLEIDREDHEISINSKNLNPTAVSCQTTADLVVGLRNTGRDDEKDVFLRIYAPEIDNFQSNIAVGDVDENDETTHALTIPVPKELAAGKYRITMDTYYDVSKKSSTDAVILTKEECSAGKEVLPEEKKDEQPIVVVTPPADTGAKDVTGDVDVIAPPAPEEQKASFVESSTFLALLILAYAVVIGGGALVAVKLLRK